MSSVDVAVFTDEDDMKGALGKERGTMLMAMTEDDGGEAMHFVFRKEGPEVTRHV